MTPPQIGDRDMSKREAAAIVAQLAACDPRPDVDTYWCYFCGGALNSDLTHVDSEQSCLLLAARRFKRDSESR